MDSRSEYVNENLSIVLNPTSHVRTPIRIRFTLTRLICTISGNMQVQSLQKLNILETYGAVHMPMAHMGTDGCEAISAFQFCLNSSKFLQSQFGFKFCRFF